MMVVIYRFGVVFSIIPRFADSVKDVAAVKLETIRRHDVAIVDGFWFIRRQRLLNLGPSSLQYVPCDDSVCEVEVTAN